MFVQPEQVVEALGVAGGLLHPPLDLVLLALDEACLRLEWEKNWALARALFWAYYSFPSKKINLRLRFKKLDFNLSPASFNSISNQKPI